jgi:hypothetical protein
MTREQYTADVEERAQTMLEAGYHVEINEAMPWVAITCQGYADFFMQGDDAATFLDGVPEDISPEAWALVTCAWVMDPTV